MLLRQIMNDAFIDAKIGATHYVYYIDFNIYIYINICKYIHIYIYIYICIYIQYI